MAEEAKVKVSTVVELPEERIKIEPLPSTIGYREFAKSRKGSDQNH